MKRVGTILIGALVLFCVSSPSLAGVWMRSTDTVSSRSFSSEVSVSESALRVDVSGTGEGQTVIFRKDKQLFWIIDLQKKTYMEMTRDELEAMAEQVSVQMEQARKMMEEQLKGVPPEQRKMVEQMMKGRIPPGMDAAATLSSPEYEKVESGVTVGSWECDHYEGRVDEEKVEDVWTAEPDELGFRREDFEVLAELGRFFQSLARSFGGSFPGFLGTEESGLSGVPVRHVRYSGGKETSRHEVEEIRQQDFDPSRFELPEGLEKRDMPIPSMQGRR